MQQIKDKLFIVARNTKPTLNRCKQTGRRLNRRRKGKHYRQKHNNISRLVYNCIEKVEIATCILLPFMKITQNSWYILSATFLISSTVCGSLNWTHRVWKGCLKPTFLPLFYTNPASHFLFMLLCHIPCPILANSTSREQSNPTSHTIFY